MSNRPRCRCCGKPLRLYTRTHNVGSLGFKFETDKLVTIEELKKTTNQQIVSVKYKYENERYEDLSPSEIYSRNTVRRVSGRRTVYSYTTWDGETYHGVSISKDPHFCTNTCAVIFAELAVECTNLQTKAYAAAIKGKSNE